MPAAHKGFPCPVCGAPSHTLESGTPRRRRECRGSVTHRFTTVEVLVEGSGDGVRVPCVAPIPKAPALTPREAAILKLLTEANDG